MTNARSISWVFAILAVLTAQAAFSQAQDAEKQAAVDRYLRAMPLRHSRTTIRT